MARLTASIFLPCALLLGNGPVSGAVLSAANLQPNNLVITEYLANPVDVSDADGEYFEVFNTTSSSIDLDGLIVRDDGSNTFTVSGLVVAANSFAVFASSDGTALGLTPAYTYGGSMSLTNGDDEIGLYRPDDELISKVSYTDGDHFGAGIAHELALLSPGLPALLLGPTLGMDFIAATESLALGNFGSPGGFGNTQTSLPAVPLPAAVWMFASALSILPWARRVTRVKRPATGEMNARTYTQWWHRRRNTDYSAAGGPVSNGLCAGSVGRVRC